MLSWDEVTKTNEYQSLSVEGRKQAREEYYKDLIQNEGKGLSQEDIQSDYKDFIQYTSKVDPKLSNSFSHNKDPQNPMSHVGDYKENPDGSFTEVSNVEEQLVPENMQDFLIDRTGATPEEREILKQRGTFDIQTPQAVNSLAHGFRQSTAALPFAPPTEYIPQSELEKLAHSTGTILGDLPAMALGGVATAGAGLPSVGAFALPEAARSVMIDKWNDVPFNEQLPNALIAGGKGALTGLGATLGGKLAPMLSKGLLPGIVGEVPAMTTVSSLLEGNLPTMDDFKHNALLAVGMHGAGKIREGSARMAREFGTGELQRRIKEPYKETIVRYTNDINKKAEQIEKLVEKRDSPTGYETMPEVREQLWGNDIDMSRGFPSMADGVTGDYVRSNRKMVEFSDRLLNYGNKDKSYSRIKTNEPIPEIIEELKSRGFKYKGKGYWDDSYSWVKSNKKMTQSDYDFIAGVINKYGASKKINSDNPVFTEQKNTTSQNISGLQSITERSMLGRKVKMVEDIDSGVTKIYPNAKVTKKLQQELFDRGYTEKRTKDGVHFEKNNSQEMGWQNKPEWGSDPNLQKQYIDMDIVTNMNNDWQTKAYKEILHKPQAEEITRHLNGQEDRIVKGTDNNGKIAMPQYLSELKNLLSVKNFSIKYMEPMTWMAERAGSGFKKMFIEPYRYANSITHKEIMELKDKTRYIIKKSGLNKNNFERIGVYAAAMNDGGMLKLASMMPKTYEKHKAMLEKIVSKDPKENLGVLSVNEQLFYDFMEANFRNMYHRVNSARRLSGVDEIKRVGNYFPFFTQFDYYLKEGVNVARDNLLDVREKLEKGYSETDIINMLDSVGLDIDTVNRLQLGKVKTGENGVKTMPNLEAFTNYIDMVKSRSSEKSVANIIAGLHKTRPRTTKFVHSKERVHNVAPIETNAYKVFTKYMQAAIEHTNVSPVIAKLRQAMNKTEYEDYNPRTGEMEKKTYMMNTDNPALYATLEGFTNSISGQTEPGIRLKNGDDFSRGFVNKLRTNIVMSLLAGNADVVVKQTAVIPFVVKEIGMHNLAQGAAFSLTNSIANKIAGKKSFAQIESREIKHRIQDAKTYFAGERASNPFMKELGRLDGLKADIVNVAFKPALFVDLAVAEATFNGAYAKHMRQTSKSGMTKEARHRQAVEYADDVVIKTSGSSSKGEIPDAYRNSTLKTVLAFTTYANFNYQFLKNEVAGVGKKMPMRERAFNIGYMGALMALNNWAFYAMGIDPVFPAPLIENLKHKDKHGKYPEGAEQAMLILRELASVHPAGGGLKYGNTPFGILGTVGGDFYDMVAHPERANPKAVRDLAFKVSGIPLKPVKYLENPEGSIPFLYDREKYWNNKKSNSGGIYSGDSKGGMYSGGDSGENIY